MNIRPKNIALCPGCGAEVRFRKTPYLHQSKTCVECGLELEVVNKNPLEVDAVYQTDFSYEEDEDFYDSDDDYDDEMIYQDHDDESVYWS